MNILIIFNRQPYDSTDVTWNGLRLAGVLSESGNSLRIFLMNDAVDMAKEACRKPDTYDHDLVIELKKLVNHGAVLKACGNCKTKCGDFKDEPYYETSLKSTMYELSDWVISNDKVISF